MAKRHKSTGFRPKSKSSLSGNFKKTQILPFLAGVLVATTVYTFFLIKNQQNQTAQQNKRQKVVLDEYQYKENLVRPTPNLQITPTDLHIKVPIIMFHYVEYVKDRGDKTRISLDIVPKTFEYQLQMLQKNGYQTYYVKDVANALNGKEKLPDKSVVLTFDDGYQDFYTDAFPLLKKYNAKATIYVINNFVGSPGYLTVDELKDIVASGLVEIGAHTLHHLYLKGLSPTTQEREIVQSKKGLEDMLGIHIDTFAYPYGAFDDNTIKIVKEASFSAAVSVIPGNVHSEDERYYLYRIRAGGFQGPYMFQDIEKDFGNGGDSTPSATLTASPSATVTP